MTKSSSILAVKSTLKTYRWGGSIIGTVLMLIAVSTCIVLNQWQYRRGEQKAVLLSNWEAGLNAKALPASGLAYANSGQIFALEGRFLVERQFLLDNQINQGRSGYDVYTPFRLISGADVLINRGWLAGPSHRALLPDISLPADTLRLEARLYVRQGLPPAFGVVAEDDRWPIRIQRADIGLMAKLAELNLRTNNELHLLDGQVGALSIRPPIAGITPEKHYAYAIQWASFAVLAVIFWLVLSIKRLH